MTTGTSPAQMISLNTGQFAPVFFLDPPSYTVKKEAHAIELSDERVQPLYGCPVRNMTLVSFVKQCRIYTSHRCLCGLHSGRFGRCNPLDYRTLSRHFCRLSCLQWQNLFTNIHIFIPEFSYSLQWIPFFPFVIVTQAYPTNALAIPICLMIFCHQSSIFSSCSNPVTISMIGTLMPETKS